MKRAGEQEGATEPTSRLNQIVELCDHYGYPDRRGVIYAQPIKDIFLCLDYADDLSQRIRVLEGQVKEELEWRKATVVTTASIEKVKAAARIDALRVAEEVICDQVCGQMVRELSGTDGEAAELMKGTTEWYHNIPDEEGIPQPPLRCAAEPIRHLIAAIERAVPQEPCSTCSGAGSDPPSEPDEDAWICPECRGTGQAAPQTADEEGGG